MPKGDNNKKGKENNRFGDKTGQVYTTNEGYSIEITVYNNAHDCSVRFIDGTILNKLSYLNIRRGNIKNPHRKSVYGVGYFGLGKYDSKTHRKIYKTWTGMVERCYDLKRQEKHPTYKGCIVAEEWHDFQNFAEWFENNYKEGFALDKDILIKGNKIYSPNTCCFVPREINNSFVKSDSIRGKYPIGISKAKDKFIAHISINGKRVRLGMFDTPEEAFQTYKTAKEVYIKEVAGKWKDQISKNVYQVMYNYKVEITD